MKNARKVSMFIGLMTTLVFLSCAVQAQASMKEIKAYKEAFPDAKVKCSTCHSVPMPKKDAAGLNAFGQATVAIDPNPTAETFKKIGKAEDFKK